MENNNIITLLAETCAEVLEKMMFLDVQSRPSYNSKCFVVEKDLLGSITFSGEYSGLLLVNCSTGLARTATINFLGVEPGEVTELQIKDTVKEMANMICGGFFSRMDSERCLTKLSIPEYGVFNGKAFPSFPSEDVLILPFSCGMMAPETEEDEVFLLEVAIDSTSRQTV